MKFVGLYLLSLSLLAQVTGELGLNHSYFITNDGTANTVRSYFPSSDSDEPMTKISGFQFGDKKEGKIEIDEAKSNYLVDKDENVYVSTSDGDFKRYPKSILDKKIKEFGESFFITKRTLYSFDNNGNFTTTSEKEIESKLGDKLKPEILGANYLITKNGKVLMINNITGQLDYPSGTVDPDTVALASNNYLVLKNGTLITFGYLQQDDGSYDPIISPIQTSATKNIAKVGGNFFFDADRNIHTISFNGLFNQGEPERKYKVLMSIDQVNRSYAHIMNMGSNYFVFADGAVYTVDRFGSIWHLGTVSAGSVIRSTK